jgi:hypothetical protein
MEILKTHTYSREGNDCWISDYVTLIRLDTHLYIVTHTDAVTGSWTGNPKTTDSFTFGDYDSARNLFESFVKQFSKEAYKV